jgi:hypothetical protein
MWCDVSSPLRSLLVVWIGLPWSIRAPIRVSWQRWGQRSPGSHLVERAGAVIGDAAPDLANGPAWTSQIPVAANALIKFISSPVAAIVLKAKGFDPGP